MAEVKFLDDTTITTLLTTELNSLANNGRVLTGAFNNDTELDILADFELVAGFAVAPAAGAVIELYRLPSVDDTNYPVGDSSNDPQALLRVGFFEVRLAQTAAQTLVIPEVRLCPRNQKFLVKNTAGQAFASANNTLKIKPYKYQST